MFVVLLTNLHSIVTPAQRLLRDLCNWLLSSANVSRKLKFWLLRFSCSLGNSSHGGDRISRREVSCRRNQHSRRASAQYRPRQDDLFEKDSTAVGPDFVTCRSSGAYL